jgi:hypothetical protein
MRTSFATVAAVLHQSDLLPDHRQHRRVRNQSDVHALHGQVGILDGAGAFGLIEIVLKKLFQFMYFVPTLLTMFVLTLLAQAAFVRGANKR